MRIQLLFILFALTLFACGGSSGSDSSGRKHGRTSALKITGSTTVGPLITRASEAFEEANEDIKITISEGGSGVGVANLLDGTTDIAMSSREMKESEKERFYQADKKVVETAVAHDALAIVLHPNNPIEQLTHDQLNQIFKGAIKNFKDVGGPDMEIVPVSRESSSGTFEFFKEVILEDSEVAGNALSQNSNGGVEQIISQTPGAIGYIGLGFMSGRVKPIKVAFEGDEYIEATPEAAKNGTYPLTRPLLLYYLEENSEKVKPFMDFLLGPEGQKAAKETGFIPVN